MKHSFVHVLVAFCCALLALTTLTQAQGIHLAYKFKAGDVNRYKETTHDHMTSEMIPAGGQDVVNEMYSTQKVDRVHTDGSAEVIQTIDSVNTLLNGEPFNNPQVNVLVGLPMRVTVTPTGKLLDVQPMSDSANEEAKQAVHALREQLMAQPSYPESEVMMNAPWQDSVSFSQPTQMGAINTTIRYSTSLTGSDTVSDTDVKVLERTIDLSGELGQGAGTLKGNGKGNIYFSDVLGKEIMSTMTIEQTLDVTTAQGPVSMSMKISTRRELLK